MPSEKADRAVAERQAQLRPSGSATPSAMRHRSRPVLVPCSVGILPLVRRRKGAVVAACSQTHRLEATIRRELAALDRRVDQLRSMNVDPPPMPCVTRGICEMPCCAMRCRGITGARKGGMELCVRAPRPDGGRQAHTQTMLHAVCCMLHVAAAHPVVELASRRRYRAARHCRSYPSGRHAPQIQADIQAAKVTAKGLQVPCPSARRPATGSHWRAEGRHFDFGVHIGSLRVPLQRDCAHEHERAVPSDSGPGSCRPAFD
jgi:hypothetical protein